MGGIAGIISLHTGEVREDRLLAMADSLHHRGPQGQSAWINSGGSTGLAATRLSITDDSAAAAQPLHYLNRYSIVFNGEIYNYRELRSDLQKAGYSFASKADTEVILAAYDCYQHRCLQYFDGMFAFAIWDELKQEVFAARDRFGEKPFFYCSQKNIFAFASEMKALWAAKAAVKTIEPKMILNYLGLGRVKNPDDKSQTFFSNIYSLPAAHYLVYQPLDNAIHIESYWEIDKQVKLDISPENAGRRFDQYLGESVKMRLRGGVSTASVFNMDINHAAMGWYASQLSPTVKFLSSFFEGQPVHDASAVLALSKSMGIENINCKPTAPDLLHDFDKLLWHQEEPFPCSEIFSQYKIFELASSHNIPVVLDAMGADETLAGYHKYMHWYLQELVSHNRFSRFQREKKLLKVNQVALRWDYKNIAAAFLPSHAAIALEKQEFNLVKYNPDVSKELLVLLKGREWDGITRPVVTKLNDILYFEVMQNGLEEKLRYADRNSMAHGCEVRMPYLNADLVKFVFSLPASIKIRDGFSKWILRSTMSDRLPNGITWNKDKRETGGLQDSWMQDVNVQEFVYESRRKLVKEGILKKQVLKKSIASVGVPVNHDNDWRYMCAAHM